MSHVISYSMLCSILKRLLNDFENFITDNVLFLLQIIEEGLWVSEWVGRVGVSGK